MKRIRRLVPLLALLVGGACSEFTVPNHNAQSISDLESGANAAGIGAAAVGLLAISREFESSFLQSYVSLTGTFGREGVELDPSNPQHPIDRLEQIGTGEPSYAGWSAGYRLVKQGNVILSALETAVGMTDAQKEGVRGFTKTLQALAFLRLIGVFDAAGLPIDVDIETSAPPAPIASKAAVHTRIAQLLDEAETHLNAAGGTFVFNFPAGFVAPATQGTGSFNTPATFLEFNRALRARVATYQADYAAALTAVGNSFMDETAPLRFGVYDTYSTRSGDRTNPLFDPTCRQLFALSNLETDAELQPGGALDQRFLDKTRLIPGLDPGESLTRHGYQISYCWTLYPTSDTPIPIIRNEELILIRAEARYFTGATALALDDINLIRQNSGGLAARGAFADATDFTDELLYNRLYSLMWEGGHRWVDARRFDRLGDLPKADPVNNFIFPHLPLPADECLPRGEPAASCDAPAGI